MSASRHQFTGGTIAVEIKGSSTAHGKGLATYEFVFLTKNLAQGALLGISFLRTQKGSGVMRLGLWAGD